MKRIVFFTLLIFSAYFAQAATFTAVQDGPWIDGATWGNASPGVEGTDFPGAGDDVYTNGFIITSSGTRNCRDLFVQYDVAGSITFSSGLIIVSGSLLGWDGDEFGFPSVLTANVFSGNSTIRFLGTNVGLGDNSSLWLFNSEAIAYWNDNTPITNVQCILGGNTITFDTSDGVETILRINALTVSAGTLQLNGNIEGLIMSGNLTIQSTATLVSDAAIYGVSGTSSRFSTANLSGTITMQNASAFLNASTFTLNSTATFNTNFSGADQTQGWWNLSAAPSSFNINAASTVNYTANAAQNIWPVAYGNLIISSGGSTVTKTLGSGSLTVNGNLTVNGANTTFAGGSNTISVRGNLVNNGVLSSSGTFIFDGTVAQTIGGTVNPSFSLLRISNTSASVGLNNVDVTVNSELDVDASASFNPSDRDVNMAGNMRIDGTLVAGTSTSAFNFTGTTSFLGSGTRNFNNISISGTLNAPSALSLAGDFANNGTFNDNNGTVTFAGTSTQTISGSSTTNFHHLVINEDVTNNGTVAIENTLTLASSVSYDADGSGAGITTLLSTSSLDARVVAIPTGSSVTGSITVQRYLPYGTTQARMYRYLGVPVSGATVAGWQDDFAISGAFTGASTGTGITSNPSMFYFDPSTGYVSYPTTSNTEGLTVGRGYAPYIRSTSPITIDVTGTLVQGNQSVSVQTGGVDNGYNLIANPYASPIDWDLVNKTGLADAIYLKDNSAIGSNGQGAYVSYVGGVGTGGFDGNIASSQAFWVQSTGATSVSFEENDKVSTAQFYLNPAPLQDILRIYAEGNGKSDDIVIRFVDGATNQDDASWDAKKFNNDFINLSSITEGQKYAINAVAPLTCDQSFALAIENFTEGSYTLTFSEWETFQMPVNATLHDAFTGESIDVKANREYTFDVITAEPLSSGQERFTLTFETEDLHTDLAVSSPKTSLCAGEVVEVVLANTQSEVQYQLLVGEKVISDWQLSQGGTLTFTVPADSLGQGATIQAVAQRSGCTEVFVLENSLAVTYPEAPQITAATDANVCLGGDAQLSVNATGASAYRWYGSADGDDLIEETTTHTLARNAIMEAETLYVSALNAAGCETSRIPVSVQIEEVIAPQAVSTNTISCANESVTLSVQADGAVSYKWYTNADSPNAFATTTEGNLLVEQIVSNITYYVTSINANGCESGRTEVSITISDAPQVIGLANQEICAGAGAEITFEAVNGATLYRLYTSEFAAEPLQENASPTFAVSPESSMSVYISAVNSNGCEGSRSASTITVVEEASIEAVAPTELCVGASASISLNTNATQVLWYSDADLSQEANFNGSMLELAEVNESISYYAVPLNALGCAGVAQEVQLIVSQPNAATVEAVTTCDLAALTLYAAGASANQEYVWFKDGQEFIRTTLGKLDITNHVPDIQWSVAIASEQGCMSEFTDLSITYSPIEQVQVSTNVSVCMGESAEITATGGSETAIYHWYASLDAESAIATGASFVSPVLEGNISYFVSLTNALGCEGERLEVQVEVIDLNPATITVEGNVLISNYSEGNQWYLNGVLLEGETSQQVEATESGTYSLVVYSQGCTTSAEQVVTVLGLGKGTAIFSRVYPNPVRDRLFIQSNQGTITAVKVFTTTGAEVSHLEIIPSGGNYEIDMSTLRNGTYIIQVTNENQIDTWRIIKQ